MNKNTTNYRHSITVKDSAIEKINSIKNRKGDNYLLKIEVVAGGCKEYQYIFSLEEIENIQDFSYLESGDSISTIESKNPSIDSQNHPNINIKDNEDLNKQIEAFCSTFETKILQTILVASHNTMNNKEDNKYYIIIKDSTPFILIDKKSFSYLSHNSYLEYQSNMTAAIFNLVNDNVLSSCGCGTSFQIKS